MLTYLTAYIMYELPLLAKNTANDTFFRKSGAVRWVAGRSVTGRIRDIGQNVLQSSFGNWANT